MKMNRMCAALAALMLVGALAGCGAKNETADAAPERSAAEENHDAPEEVAVPDALEAPAVEYEAKEAMEAEKGMAGDRTLRPEAYLAGEEAVFGAADGAMMDDGAVIGDVVLPDKDPAVSIPAEVGVLTAAEWKDHENWGFFANLVNSDTISFPSFGIDPTQRIAVTVTNPAGDAMPNAKVQLLDADGNAIWNAVSDKTGTAYLFETNGRKAVKLTVENGDGATSEAEIGAAAGTDTQSVQRVSDRQFTVTVDGAAITAAGTQVMFIVDTTGSMGDEMLYLQSDFGAIAEDAGTDQTSYAVSFYRDEGDAYVTKLGSGFTSDPAQIRSALAAEYADGGGDTPEAVAEALSEAFAMDDWNDDTVKIAFLIYDAPPHEGKEKMLTAAIEEAAAKGIRIVPVVSSNSDRETELFGRAAAICTGGTYVFLTDDSGVGGSHLEPIIGDYEVEKLHDIIVRIITEARQ